MVLRRLNPKSLGIHLGIIDPIPNPIRKLEFISALRNTLPHRIVPHHFIHRTLLLIAIHRTLLQNILLGFDFHLILLSFPLTLLKYSIHRSLNRISPLLRVEIILTFLNPSFQIDLQRGSYLVKIFLGFCLSLWLSCWYYPKSQTSHPHTPVLWLFLCI